jgi:geranylgeranyl diphosphate synthase, type II
MTYIKKEIEKEIESLFEIPNTPERLVYESMKYSMLAGGKRIRPILALKTYEIISGKKKKDILKFACAIEMIHTYSLIHDDLPAMDNDDFRRGKPTNHKIYGEAIAILAGDGLLNLAYETMLEAMMDDFSHSERYIKAIREIAKASGVKGMIGGQVADILSDSEKMDIETLEYIHKNKTSVLIESSIISGALIAGASPDEIEALRVYAESIGFMFQVRDDILDKIGSSEELGDCIWT